MLKAFSDYLDPTELMYDYVSGVSIGAINASIISLYSAGEEKQAIAELENLYLSLNTNDFW